MGSEALVLKGQGRRGLGGSLTPTIPRYVSLCWVRTALAHPTPPTAHGRDSPSLISAGFEWPLTLPI